MLINEWIMNFGWIMDEWIMVKMNPDDDDDGRRWIM
jgi:hypothetical protein